LRAERAARGQRSRESRTPHPAGGCLTVLPRRAGWNSGGVMQLVSGARGQRPRPAQDFVTYPEGVGVSERPAGVAQAERQSTSPRCGDHGQLCSVPVPQNGRLAAATLE
jgi:hypothetical protein